MLFRSRTLMGNIDSESEARFKAKREAILEHATPELKQAVIAASEKGASSWVTASPSYDHGTVLHKRDFVDSCYMRYGWTLLDLPISCACGNAFNVQHALDCKLGVRIQHTLSLCGKRLKAWNSSLSFNIGWRSF